MFASISTTTHGQARGFQLFARLRCLRQSFISCVDRKSIEPETEPLSNYSQLRGQLASLLNLGPEVLDFKQFRGLEHFSRGYLPFSFFAGIRVFLENLRRPSLERTMVENNGEAL